ncbi:DUF4393 domain-containing protein [Mycobacterium sp. M1]|uniref:DUF4393 domain-containing protein n=1 Tax=Mycolicibacter acidiphilus TaxID=2835306 RepID=A0ABS5RLC4_9MYCO|nr:Abi-alpha family protein [Mycolicibacter acidiphilus]MBS9534792.1 DUF4393 domain-containing protein [Mycolicibacter acidiphilus]
MASDFDASAVIDLTEQAVRGYLRAALWTERRIFDMVRSRLVGGATHDRPAPTTVEGENPSSLGAKMHGLLDRAVEQSTAASCDELFHRILDQLVPDEARVISALSDGSSSALLSVYARTRTGQAGEAILENIALIGKSANLTLPRLTPMYVSHLLALSLVETGPEDAALKDEYEILAADTAVLQAVKTAGRGPLPARIEYGTLRLSALGMELWAAANRARDPE